MDPRAMNRQYLSTGQDPRLASVQRRSKTKKVEHTNFLGAAPKSAKVSHVCLDA